MYDSPFGGLFSLIILVLDIMAIVDIIRSSKSLGMKLLWTLVILFLPVLGLILYAIFGRERHPIYRP
jgi:hypothetical protein